MYKKLIRQRVSCVFPSFYVGFNDQFECLGRARKVWNENFEFSNFKNEAMIVFIEANGSNMHCTDINMVEPTHGSL